MNATKFMIFVWTIALVTNVFLDNMMGLVFSGFLLVTTKLNEIQEELKEKTQ